MVNINVGTCEFWFHLQTCPALKVVLFPNVIYGPFCGIKCQKTNNGNLKSHLPKKPDMIKKYITNFNEKTHFAKSNYDNFAVTVTII